MMCQKVLRYKYMDIMEIITVSIQQRARFCAPICQKNEN